MHALIEANHNETKRKSSRYIAAVVLIFNRSYKNKGFVDRLLVYIIVHRTEETYTDYSNRTAVTGSSYSTGDYPITLTLLFRNEVSDSEPAVSYVTENNRIKRKLRSLLDFQIVGLYVHSVAAEIYRKGIKHRNRVPTDAGYDYTVEPGLSGLSVRIGCMRAHIADRFFEALKTAGILKPSEVVYFKSICGHAIPTEFELKNLAAIEAACKARNYKGAVELAKIIHDAAMKTNQERCKSVCSNDDGTAIYFDDENSAFLLGMRLRTLSPADAIEAFKILTEESPDYVEARQEMAHLYLTVEGSAEHRRLARRKAMEDTLMASVISQDRKAAAQGAQTFIKLLEEHAGFKSMGAHDRLFAGVEISNFESPEDFCKIIFTMADALYAGRKVSGKIAAESQKSQKTANDTLLFSTQAATASVASNSTRATATTAGAASAAAAAAVHGGVSTYSGCTTGSLDDDEITFSVRVAR